MLSLHSASEFSTCWSQMGKPMFDCIIIIHQILGLYWFAQVKKDDMLVKFLNLKLPRDKTCNTTLFLQRLSNLIWRHRGIIFYVFDDDANICDSPSEVVLLVIYYLGRKMFQFIPLCSTDRVRVRADMRILPSAVTNTSLKTRKMLLDGIKRLTKKSMHYLTSTILSKKEPNTGVQFAPSSWWVSNIFHDVVI